MDERPPGNRVDWYGPEPPSPDHVRVGDRWNLTRVWTGDGWQETAPVGVVAAGPRPSWWRRLLGGRWNYVKIDP